MTLQGFQGFGRVDFNTTHVASRHKVLVSYHVNIHRHILTAVSSGLHPTQKFAQRLQILRCWNLYLWELMLWKHVIQLLC